jgi:large exoprotein involved in heme utilization and adhesion
VAQVQQRDAEVAVLMRLLPGAPPNLQQLIAAQLQQQQQQQQVVVGGKGSPAKPGPPAGSDRDATAVRDAAMAAVGTSAAAGGGGGEGAGGKQEQVLSALLDVNLLVDRHRAFEVFRKSYRQNEVWGWEVPRGLHEDAGVLVVVQGPGGSVDGATCHEGCAGDLHHPRHAQLLLHRLLFLIDTV